jgi:hypothetical protein
VQTQEFRKINSQLLNMDYIILNKQKIVDEKRNDLKHQILCLEIDKGGQNQ